jgi:hypothetical protein
MGDRMLFDEAVKKFREFLHTQGHSGPLQWIAPGDVAFWCGELLIRRRNGAEDHAKHVFDRAQERGFGVSIQAIARLDHSICCFVFAPDDAEDAARHFVAPPLTMKVHQGLRPAQEPSGLLWWAATTLRSTRARCRDHQFFGYDLDRRNAAENI